MFDSIVGYQFQADTYCPDHIIAALPTGDGDPYEGWALAPSVTMSTEDNLTEIAAHFQIERTDENTFDSGDFPKIILEVQVDGTDRCSVCHRDLIYGELPPSNFDRELVEFTTLGLLNYEHDVKISVYKIGGGTVGKKYTGTWGYLVEHLDEREVIAGEDYYTGTPTSHAEVAQSMVIWAVEDD